MAGGYFTQLRTHICYHLCTYSWSNGIGPKHAADSAQNQLVFKVKSCLSVKVCEQCRLKSSLLHERGRDGELLDLCGVAEVEPVAVGGEVDGGDDARVGRHEVGGEHAVDREG